MSATNGTAEKLLNRLATSARYIRWQADPHTRTEDWATVSQPVTVRDLQQHLDGKTVLGAYPYEDDAGTARTGILDIDLHVDEPAPEQIATVEVYAVRKLRELHDRGVVALLVRGHDRGSLHIIFDTAPIAADRLGRWLAAFVSDAEAAGVHTDTFPSTSGRGNAVRLPGRHHKYTDQWSASWSGTGWEPWPAALDRLFTLTPNPARLFPDPGTKRSDRPAAAPGAATRAGDLFNAKNPPEQVLVARGWHSPREENDRLFLTRPGKESGNSAAIKDGTAWIYTHSVPELPSSEVSGKPYTAFALIAHLDHGGDFAKAARELARAGYATPSTDPKPAFGPAGGTRSDPRDAPAWRAPAPLPEMPPVPPFPVGVFPSAVSAYWAAASESLGYPVDYVAVPALSLLGAAVGRTMAVEVKRSYSEPPILWTGLVAPPGAAKSPSLKFALGPLPATAEQWVADYHREMKEFRTESLRYKGDLKDWEKGGCDGEPPEEPTQPTVRQLVFSNFTIEALIRGNSANPRGVVVCKDELSGLVASLNQYKGGKGDDRQHLLSMWAGAAVIYNREKDRQSGVPPLTLAHSFLGVGGMIQPELLGAFRGDLGRDHVGNDGWADRFLLSFPDMPRATGERWAVVPEDVEAGYAAVFQELLSWKMVPVTNEDGEVVSGRPYFVPLDSSARSAWEEFTAAVADRMNALDPLDNYRGVLSKSRHHVVRLTALLHALRRACGEVAIDAAVTAETVVRAVALMNYFEAHGRRCLGVGWLDQRFRVAKRLVAWLQRHPQMVSFTRSDAFIQLKDTKDVTRSEHLDAPFRALVDLNYIRPLGQSPTGGRPAEAYEVNPAWDRNAPEPIPNIPNKPPHEVSEAPLLRDIRDGFSGFRDGTGSGDEPDTDDLGNGGLPLDTSPPSLPPGPHPAAASPKPDTGTAYTLVTATTGLSDVVTAIEDGGGVIGLDTETTGLNSVTNKVRLIQLATARGTFIIDVSALPNPRADLEELFEVLARAGVVGHNLAFDLSFLARLGFVPGRVADVMLASQVLHAGEFRTRHGLKDVAARVLNLTLDKTEQKADWSKALTPEMLGYAARDAETPLAAWEVQKGTAADAKLSAVLDAEMAAVPAVAWALSKGVGFDRAAWESLATEAERKQDQLREQLDTTAPANNLTGSRNWNAPAEVIEAFASVGVAIEGTDDDTLAGIDHPLAALVREYRGLAKLVGTYGRKWLKNVAADSRVYASWKQLGAEATGRMSCKEPNLQQLPRDTPYRKCFVAPPGRTLVKADYSQIELRIAAKLTGDKRMLDAYRDNLDVHTMTARALLGKDEVSKADRQLAKAVNFGLLYGQGAKGLMAYALGSYGVTLTEAEATTHRETFFKTYAGLRAWHQKVRHTITGKFDADPNTIHDVRTLGGRRRLLPVAKKPAGRKPYPNITEALNTPVQGTGADGLKAALALLWERRDRCPDAFPVLIVHDEIVVECDEDKADAAVAWVRAAMIDGMSPLIAPVAVEVEATIGRTWGG